MRFHRIAAATIVATLSAAALVACSTGPGDPEEETVLRIASSTPVTFDVINIHGQLHGDAVYDSLVIAATGVDGGGAIPYQPWLAESFSYNEDRTVLTLQIRDDVDFTDGEHLDAEVVKQNIDLQRRPENASSTFYSAVEDVVVTGEYTVEVRMSRADDQFLNMMRRPVVSPSALEDREGLKTTPVGSGPYVLESADGDAAYTFVRNEDYWNPEAFPFDRVELTIMPDVTARMNALKSGQVDVAQIDVLTAGEAESSGFEIHTFHALWQGLLLGDRRGEVAPPLADVRVRRAIVMALDREGYAEALGGGLGNPSNQVGVPGQDAFYLPELADEYAYDLEAARELLTEAGYPDGFDLRIPTSASFAQFQPYYEQAFADLGIRVEWVNLQPDQFWPEFQSGAYAVVPTTAGYWELAFVKVDGFGNPWGNMDDETEQLLREIAEGDAEEWLEARSRLTEKILDEAWFAILAHEPNVWASDPGLTLEFNQRGGIALTTIQPD